MLRRNLGRKVPLGDFTKGGKFLSCERVWILWHGDIVPRHSATRYAPEPW